MLLWHPYVMLGTRPLAANHARSHSLFDSQDATTGGSSFSPPFNLKIERVTVCSYVQREEAAEQLAAAAKATKKVRKRATKAASRNAAQPPATHGADLLAAPVVVDGSTAAASSADGSGVREAEQPRAETAEVTPGSLPEARQNGLPQWMMCPITKVPVYPRSFVSDHCMCRSLCTMRLRCIHMLQHLGFESQGDSRVSFHNLLNVVDRQVEFKGANFETDKLVIASMQKEKLINSIQPGYEWPRRGPI